MTKLVLEKAEEFHHADDNTQRKLESIFGKKFNNISELHEELYNKQKLPLNIYLPKENKVKITTLPFTIKDWPLYYNKGPSPYGIYEIAKVKIID